MNSGWIKIHRKLLDWEYYGNSNMVRVFLHLILNANFEDKEWKGTVIKRGQLVVSLNTLSDTLNITRSVTRTCLKRLTESHTISTQSDNQKTIVTICNYDSYQVQTDDVIKPNRTRITRKLAHDGSKIGTRNDTRNAHDLTLTKENKEIEEHKRTKEDIALTRANTNIPIVYNGFDFTFVDPAYSKMFGIWLDYKQKEQRFRYKSQTSLEICYRQLVGLSGGDPKMAMAIIAQSIACGYKGLFALKKDCGWYSADNTGFISQVETYINTIKDGEFGSIKDGVSPF